ncbi:PLP-dependent transferase [Russula ochroleuca]|uniref:sphinganine-1-phosphate aldolase n=1 Tax=Russula ochroleuca TaxID=152965 RepID=A0A9P5TB86_9AGAM|nr:PLP-dependent transferase [Russula ochroleuca]
MSTLSVPRIIDVVDVFQRNCTLDTAKNGVLVYFFAKRALKLWRHVRARGLRRSFTDLYVFFAQKTLRLIIKLPSMRKKVDTGMDDARAEINRKLLPQGKDVVRHLALPKKGCTLEWILDEMEQMDLEAPSHTDYRDGKLSGAVYHGGDDMEKVLVAAFQRYCVSNPLHPDVFPAVRKMEAEIVAMCLRMYNNPTGAGATTSGGTESILMSVKTHRDWARAVKGIFEPEMVVPASVHAAFDKAAAYFNIKLHSIPVDPESRQVDLKLVRRAINSNTIMVAGSAINFPDGCQDDIVGLGKLAKRYNIGLHVDCCLGSFIMPFLEKAGFPSEPFDFRVEGVTAISCDTHKYGFAPKGSSVIMYRSADLRQYQYYVNPDWSGGVYASPGLAGSRSGALIAGTWAAMHYMGEEGYISSCRDIVGSAKAIREAIQTLFPELYVLGKPQASVVAFGSRAPSLNILEVGDIMSKKGWHLNALQNPPGVHIACTRLTVSRVDDFIRDLKDAVWDAKGCPEGKGNMVTLYGLGNSSAIGPEMVGAIVTAFLDALYKA